MPMASPRIADVTCVPLRFHPGDKILVKLKHAVDPAAKAKLKKSIEKWAGDHVEVLIIELPIMELEIIKSPLVVKLTDSL